MTIETINANYFVFVIDNILVHSLHTFINPCRQSLSRNRQINSANVNDVLFSCRNNADLLKKIKNLISIANLVTKPVTRRQALSNR